MEFLKEFLSREVVRRSIFLLTVCFMIYLFSPMMNLLLLTFVFTFLMNSAQSNIVSIFNIKSHLKEKAVTILLYALVIAAICFVGIRYVPILVLEITGFFNQLSVDDFKIGSEVIDAFIAQVIQQIDFANNIKSLLNTTIQLASKIGSMGLQAFIALMLSMFFILEKKKVFMFLAKFKTSKISALYKYFAYYGTNFLNTFGKVMQAQILIALVNSLISICMLYVMGFPNLATLWIMIFVLSLVPVAGVLVSLVPLAIIAFKIGGITKIIYVLMMVGVVHAIETYFLNPQLMSAKVDLPIFFTFIILLAAEHFIGIWGLLIGIPLFIFLLEILDVKL